MTTKCEVPPSGWVCSRAKGHEGPCAASPAPANKPLQFCKTCGTNIEFYQCWCEKKPESVATSTEHCEGKNLCALGGHCRCVEGDEHGCWNWVKS